MPHWLLQLNLLLYASTATLLVIDTILMEKKWKFYNSSILLWSLLYSGGYLSTFLFTQIVALEQKILVDS